MPDNKELYRTMVLIRMFEETVLQEFSRGVFHGTTHTYTGQEANAVGVLNHLLPGDIVFSNHRCHGHFLAYGGDPRALFAELMGKNTGVCGGRGGSQHIHWRDFYSNGIQGSIVPLATGMAIAEKFKGNEKVVIAFLGDGTLGQGVLYEALNLASLWRAPILYVLENNHIAQTTPIELAVAGKISSRFNAFEIPTREIDTSDVCEISPIAGEQLASIRKTGTPGALILHTHRFGPHSKGDDTRPQDYLEKIQFERDPIKIQQSRLSKDEAFSIRKEVETLVLQAFDNANNDPYPGSIQQ
jgi:TPP-dependent pyruvate/acetoin dehydrogenase alpha subunit